MQCPGLRSAGFVCLQQPRYGRQHYVQKGERRPRFRQRCLHSPARGRPEPVMLAWGSHRIGQKGERTGEAILAWGSRHIK